MSKRRLSSRLRIQFLGLFMLLGVGSLGLRLWWIQVAHGPEWTAQIRGSSQATVRIPSVRGEIKDRNGVTLVQNRASYEVDFYLPDMVRGYRERFGSPPTSEYRATINGMPKDVKEPDIIKIVNQRHRPASERPGPCARLQCRPVAETLSQRHRSSVFLRQRHRFSNAGEIFRA